MSTEPGPLLRGTGFALAATGILALAAGAQVGTFFIIANPWLGLVPPTQMALGLACLVLGGGLAVPKGWARAPALITTLVLLAISTPWVLWLLLNGVITVLVLLAPTAALVSLVGVALTWREAGRVSAAIAAVERENARILEEAAKNPDPLWDPPKPRNTWFYPVVGVVVGLPVAALATYVIAPPIFDWADMHVRGLAAGRLPFRSVWVSAPTSYPYSGSPFAWYLDYEEKWGELPRAEILATADAIADHVAWRLAAETGTSDPVEGEARLWAAGKERELPLWVAEALRDRGAFYSPESLLSRSFDPQVHVVPDTIHLDCDLLVYLFLHVGWRMDLAMEAVPSPFHVYLKYSAPDGSRSLYVETTQFRHIDVNGSRVDFMGQGIGEDFFPDADYYRSGRSGSWASPELADAAGLYEPWEEQDIRDAIVANVLVGVERSGRPIPFIAESEAHLEGTHQITLVANLYRHYLDEGEVALAEGRLDDAEALARKAVKLRAEKGPLVIYMDAKEEDLLARVERARGVASGG